MCLDRWFNNNKEFKNKIIAELAKLKNKLSTTQQNIYDIYLTELQVKTRYNYYYASFSLEERLSNHPLYLHWQKILPEILTKPISSYFSDDEKIVLQTILGKDKADLFFLALDNLMDYPYQTNWYRRTLRSHQSHLYLSRMFDVLNEFLIYRNTQLTPLEKLKLSRKPIDENNLPLQDYIYLQSFGIYVLAAEIDNNNTQTIKLIEDIILGDNQVAFLSYGLINSIVKSHNQHLHKLLGDLLLAGRLQEGLRQSITENMDNGTVEAFLTLLKVIEENNLIRYASIKRAIATWTSLIDIDNADKITKKEIASFSKFLTNEQLRHQSLNSQNPVEIYLALWSYAFYNVETTIPFILDLFKNGQKHQKLVAGYFLNVINDNQIIFKLRYELVTQYNLTEDNLSLIAILFRLKLKDTAYKNFLEHNFSSTQLMDYYYKLKALSQNLPKEKIFSPCVFLWHTEILNLSDVLIEMADISYYLAADELLDDFCSEISRLDTFWRDNYLKKLYTTPKTLTQRQLVFCLLTDRSEATRKESYNIINKLAISKDEYDLLISMLKYKYSDLRQNIIRLLLKQPEKQLLDTLKILLSDKKGSLRLAGLDILLQLQKNPHNQTLFNTAKTYLCTLTNPTTNEQILISQINDSYDNDPTIKELSYDTTLKTQLALSEINNSLKITDIYPLSLQELFQIVDDLSNFYEKHKMLSYNPLYGSEILLDNDFRRISWEEKFNLYKYPYPNLWQDFYAQYIKTPAKLYQLYLFISLNYFDINSPFKDVITNTFNDNSICLKSKYIQTKLNNYPRIESLATIIENLYEYYVPQKYCFEVAKFWTLRHLEKFNFNKVIAKQNKMTISFLTQYHYGSKSVGCTFILMPLLNNYNDDISFKESFILLYNLYTKYKYEIYLPIYNFLRAKQMNLIAEDELYIDIFQRSSEQLSSKLNQLSSLFEENFSTLAFSDFSAERPTIKQDLLLYSQNFADIIISQILSIELKRGDLPTKYTKLINNIKQIKGIHYFVDILTALGKSKLKNISYLWSEVTNKDSIFSYLLSICKPKKDETAKDLKAYLKDKSISNIRLIEACIFSPSWIPLVDKILKWKGFFSGCYYFLAHMRYADKKLAATFAKYTPISIEDLRDGAFDLDWFKSCYKQLGKERFAILYDAAKYISEGNAHTRARKYADATNGLFSADEVKAQIIEKRNKDLLMAYGLIPLSKSGKITKTAQKEILKRYIFIQQFHKESKKFGSQRQSSENLACKIALNNLARNAHFSNTFRFILNMETQLIKNQQQYFEPKELENISIYLQVDEYGKTSIICQKQNKQLKSVPSKIKKEPYYLALKQAKNEFIDQYRRSKIMFEQAMENSTLFLADEITLLNQNPILKPLLQNLVFIHDNDIGYFQNNSLISPTKDIIKLNADDKIRIAHPIDLYKSNLWHIYQQDLFTRQIKQPFKQIFRELYLKIDDELNSAQSHRYDGYQIQPQKTQAVLKTRNWIASYYEGLQKVYYQENIIATIYAAVDWFTPADIEAPILEYVSFYDRKTFKDILIKDIPDIIFSEVMRDVDLAISIAHVGGVDPETSHSTIQMRKAILEFTLPLFKLNNVSLNDNFAIIKGNLADYSIHLGSGLVHQMAGAEISISVVPSQHRGRLFLPFVDEDPKTAEIITKVLLFAKDNDIKDPFILNQIKVVK